MNLPTDHARSLLSPPPDADAGAAEVGGVPAAGRRGLPGAGGAMSRSHPGAAVRGPRRLLHVTTAPQTLRFLDGHVRYTKGRGTEVHALSSPGPMLDLFAGLMGVAVHPVPMPRRITPFSDLRALWGIGRVIGRLRPDVVHGHTPKGGLLAMVAAWLCRVPVRVYHMYGLPLLTARGLKRHVLRQAEQTACRLA